MTRKESSERFNSLPEEHRITIIANECEQEIRFLEREKVFYIKQHKENLKRINNRIKMRDKWLKELQ